MLTSDLRNDIENGLFAGVFDKLYSDDRLQAYQVKRYSDALIKFEKKYGEKDVIICSAPGRSEICGNHTDHQSGEILAAAVNLDIIAVVALNDTDTCSIVSEGYEKISLDLKDVEEKAHLEGTSKALVMGVICGLKEKGYKTGGFDAFITGDVTGGAGLSSSAAFETLIGTIVNYGCNEGCIDAITIAQTGQYAENHFFGKPCGLMDQMACSVGSAVHVDFGAPVGESVHKTELDLDRYGYSLCITDTGGSHAGLTDRYAAIPAEMKQIAGAMGRENVTGISREELLEHAAVLREQCGDRAWLRAWHCINENDRVRQAVAAIRNDDFQGFLSVIEESGDSSYKCLQNVYCDDNAKHQNIAVALAVSKDILKGGKGVCRVHGGGFAGTIQAFVRNEHADEYREAMNRLFGDNACNVLKIRKYGGTCVNYLL